MNIHLQPVKNSPRTDQLNQLPLNFRPIVNVLQKRPDQRLVSEIETYLIPLMKKVDFFKDKKSKDHQLIDFANALKFEYHPNNTVVTDKGKTIFAIFVEGGYEKLYIVVYGKVSIAKKNTMLNSDSQVSGKYLGFAGSSQSVNVFGLKSAHQRASINKMAFLRQRTGHLNIASGDISGAEYLSAQQIKKSSNLDANQSSAEPDRETKSSRNSSLDENGDHCLQAGGFFGIQALISQSSNEQSYTATTASDTFFAVLSIADYQKCLSKFEAKAVTKTLYFLQELPFFKQWSKTMLTKLLQSFKTVKFQRGQLLFKEGLVNDDVYIVRSGEFSANRTIMFTNQNVNQSVIQYIRGQKTHSTLRSVFNPQFNQLTKVNQITNASKTKESLQLFLFGQGQIFGEERLVRDEQLSPYTAVCASLEGECLKISSADFMKKIFANADALAVLKSNLNQKEQKIQYKQVAGIYNQLWQNQKQTSTTTSGNTQDQFIDPKVSKLLLTNNNEKREGLRQIVEGYPNLKRINKIIKEDEDNKGRAFSLNGFTRLSSPMKMSINSFTPVNIMNGTAPFGGSQGNIFQAQNTILTKQTTELSKSVSPPPNKEATIMIDTTNFTTAQRYSNAPGTVIGKPPKKQGGNKAYVSSKIVDALVQIKQHTEKLGQKRADLKEHHKKPKMKIIEDNFQHLNSQFGEELHIQDQEEIEQTEWDESQYMDDNGTQYQDIPDDITVKSGVSRINFNNGADNQQYATKISHFFDQSVKQHTMGTEIAASTAGDETQESESPNRHLRRSRMNQSRKSLRSLGVNEIDVTRKQVININEDDLVHLPNKSFYNSDGTKIQILGTLGSLTPGAQQLQRFNFASRERNAFSPLIQHLLKQRQYQEQQQSKFFPGILKGAKTHHQLSSTQTFKSNASLNNNKKIEEKIVFMQVAGTINTAGSHQRRGGNNSLGLNGGGFNHAQTQFANTVTNASGIGSRGFFGMNRAQLPSLGMMGTKQW